MLSRRCFFFHGAATTDIYTSFPTRRSSDLWIDTWADPDGDGLFEYLRRHPANLRSEEHTSELQSRRDLVCRLLLEKKKGSGSRDSGPPQSQHPAAGLPDTFRTHRHPARITC